MLPVEQLELFVKSLISFQFSVEDSLVKDLQMEDVSPNTPFGQDEFSPRQVSFTQFWQHVFPLEFFLGQNASLSFFF